MYHQKLLHNYIYTITIISLWVFFGLDLIPYFANSVVGYLGFPLLAFDPSDYVTTAIVEGEHHRYMVGWSGFQCSKAEWKHCKNTLALLKETVQETALESTMELQECFACTAPRSLVVHFQPYLPWHRSSNSVENYASTCSGYCHDHYFPDFIAYHILWILPPPFYGQSKNRWRYFSHILWTIPPPSMGILWAHGHIPTTFCGYSQNRWWSSCRILIFYYLMLLTIFHRINGVWISLHHQKTVVPVVCRPLWRSFLTS